MIVDLRLNSKRILVVGGGREAAKRVASMMQEDCSITVVSPVISEAISDMARSGRITLVHERADTFILERTQPDMVVAATDDHSLNRTLMAEAHRLRVLCYSSSDPQYSDYANLAQAEFGGMVRVAVSTGGRSPAMAKRIRDDIRNILAHTITPQMLSEIETLGAERTTRRETVR